MANIHIFAEASREKTVKTCKGKKEREESEEGKEAKQIPWFSDVKKVSSSMLTTHRGLSFISASGSHDSGSTKVRQGLVSKIHRFY